MPLIGADARGGQTTLRALTLVLVARAGVGCATETRGAAATKPAASPAVVSAGAHGDTAGDAGYYRQRSAALAREASDEILRTDFTRFRHGRLYALGVADSKAE